MSVPPRSGEIPAADSGDVSPPAAGPRPIRAALPRAIEDELSRIARRWRELPADRAVGAAPVLRRAVTAYAALSHPGIPVPDLGEAALPDQLRVVVYDAVTGAAAGGLVAAIDSSPAEELAALRRSLP